MSTSINSAYTESVLRLVKAIDNKAKLNSLYADARQFFESYQETKQQRQSLQSRVTALKEKLNLTPKDKNLQAEHKVATDKLAKFEDGIQLERLTRLDRVLQVCTELLSLSDGQDQNETWFKSGKFLGTLLLISPGTGKQLPKKHQCLKSPYKAILSLRLMDQLLESEKVTNPYITKYWSPEERFNSEGFESLDFNQAVVLPIMLCSIFQDVGMCHPDALEILSGPDNKDPFRILEAQERKKLLKLNYQYTQLYLKEGLGSQKYRGNSKQQRDEFVELEKERLTFQQSLIRDASVQKSTLGEIIKIPQIYTSMVLSTKHGYKRSDLPKAALLIEQMAKKEVISQTSADAFVDMVGYFPQGYGICFVPEEQFGTKSFEYAIVVGLRPSHKQKPYCKIVTKKQIFVSAGNNIRVVPQQNMHYAETRKRYSSIGDARLSEIMDSLSHNFDVEGEDSPVPAFWDPHDFFINKGMQNLWARADAP